MSAAWHRCVMSATQASVTFRHASALSGDFARQYGVLPRDLMRLTWPEFVLLVEGLSADAVFVAAYQAERTEQSVKAATVGTQKRTREQFLAQLRRHKRGKVIEQ